ncbi:MAG: single-stranded DNA-binding protein [Lachnospiraceae bacterium]|nr:single-stranded DNA-binding protein [Lachnospiraceae bacterium]
MNKVILMGRLVDDPEIYDSADGDAIGLAKFRLAVDRRFKKRNDDVTADFFNCVAFGRCAEFTDQYLRKAVKIVLVGRIENYSYTNNDGKKVYGTQIIAEEFDFAESKAASQSSQGNQDDPGYRAPDTGSGRQQLRQSAGKTASADGASASRRSSAGASRKGSVQADASNGNGSGRNRRQGSGRRSAANENRTPIDDRFDDVDELDELPFQ